MKIVQIDWLTLAKQLPKGTQKRFRHCGKDAAATAYNQREGFSFYCHRCGEYGNKSPNYRNFRELLQTRKRDEQARTNITSSAELPEDFTLDIPPTGMSWLVKASITPHMARKAGFGWTPYFRRVILPVYDNQQLVYYQARAVINGQHPKYLNPDIDRNKILYWNKHKPPTKEVIITEDILSAYRIFHATHIDTASILGTKLTIQQANQLTHYKQIILWLDPDKAGRNANTQIRKLLDLVTQTTYISLTKDPKLLTDIEIQKAYHALH